MDTKGNSDTSRTATTSEPDPPLVQAFIAMRCHNGHGGMVPTGTRIPAYCGRCGLHNIYREVPRAAIENEWHPIETAPMDGTDVLTFGRAGFVVARYEDDAWRVYNCGYEDATVRKMPTHWMLLPDTPVAKAREAQGATADPLPPEGKPKSPAICVCGGLRDDGTTYCLGHTPTASKVK